MIPNLSEITTTTIKNYAPMMADAVTENSALLKRLKKKGKVKMVMGGETIIQPLEYAENVTGKWYTGYEILDIRPSEVFSAAEYVLKEYSINVTISGREMLQNAGEQQMRPLLAAKVSNAYKTMVNQLSAGVYSDGTGFGGKQITGLLAQVSSAPSTGIVGGIDRASWTFWRNQAAEGTLLAPAAPMRKMWLKLCRNNEKPDLIVADDAGYEAYWGSLTELQRFSSQRDEAGMGWSSLKFNTADLVLDGGIGGSAPENTLFFLNTDYLFWRPHSDQNMGPIEPATRYPINQNALVKPLGFAGNLCMNNAMFQGVVTLS